MAKIFNIIVISIIIAVSGFFIVYPKYQEVMLLRNQVTERKADIYHKEERLASLEKIFSQFQQYQQKLRKIDAALPEEPSFPTLFAFLQRTVSENGLILEGISFTPTVSRKKQVSSKKTESSMESSVDQEFAEGQESTDEGGGTELASEVQEIYFSFNSTGSYDALKNFISSLEKSSKIWEIISLSISSSDDKESAGLTEEGNEGTGLSATFNIKTHSY